MLGDTRLATTMQVLGSIHGFPSVPPPPHTHAHTPHHTHTHSPHHITYTATYTTHCGPIGDQTIVSAVATGFFCIDSLLYRIFNDTIIEDRTMHLYSGEAIPDAILSYIIIYLGLE